MDSALDPNTCTLQEAASLAGFEDYRLENGGGIRSWDNSREVGIVFSEKQVRALAKVAMSERRFVSRGGHYDQTA